MNSPRLLYLGNNRLGVNVLRFLVEEGAELAALVVHSPARARFADELREIAGLPADQVFEGPQLTDPGVLTAISSLAPDLGVSVMFGYILRPPLIQRIPRGIVNLHPSLLPWNRGAYPNVWSIVERTPSGATLHYIDEGVDTGDLIAQREVAVEPTDTGATLYQKLERTAEELFRDTWPLLAAGAAPRQPQRGGGTEHRVRDVERIDRLDLDRTYTGRELIDVLRARTYPPHRGAFFETEDGRRVYVRVELEMEAEPGGDTTNADGGAGNG